MTETSFYILFSLQNEMHGYNVMQYVRDLTDSEIILGAGTVYTSLSKMDKDGLINLTKTEGNRKFYKITELGHKILDIEIKRIERLFKNISTEGGLC